MSDCIGKEEDDGQQFYFRLFDKTRQFQQEMMVNLVRKLAHLTMKFLPVIEASLYLIPASGHGFWTSIHRIRSGTSNSFNKSHQTFNNKTARKVGTIHIIQI